MNIFMSPKIAQKQSSRYVSSLETSGKYPLLYYFDCFSEGYAMHESKRVQRKNLAQPGHILKGYIVCFKMCHLGMPTGQTRSVKAGI